MELLLEWVYNFIRFITIGSLVIISLGILLFILSRLIKKLNFEKNLQKALLSNNLSYLAIKIPNTNDRGEIAMEEFLRSLHRLLPHNVYVSLEMVSNNQFLRFYMTINKSYKALLESQLYAQYPEAEIEETTDFIPNYQNNIAAVEMHFKKSSIFPVGTYSDVKENIFKNLSAILSKTESKEMVYFQIVLKRLGSKIQERGLLAWYQKNVKKNYKTESSKSAYTKLSSDLYSGILRIAYAAKDEQIARVKLETIVNLYKAIKNSHNEFKKKKVNWSPRMENIFKARIFNNGDYWTPSEAATVFHFPYRGSLVSNIVNTTSKRAPAPDILPAEGLVDKKEVSLFGETNYRNERKVFGIKRVDRRRHLYVVGKTGSGKSRLLELLLISDIQDGHGCCLLDPHGDLASELLKYIPKDRIGDVVYVDPSDRDFPIGFNPLESVENYEERQHLSTFFISIFKKLFSASWNQRMEHLVRYITLALLETPDSNVLGIPRMLADTSFRQRVIMQIKDPVVKGFWTNEFSASAEAYSREAVVPILNKVGQFISNPIVRNMIGQRKNSLDFGKFMNEGKIVLLNISKGKLGDENAALLGSMFITKIQQAALARAGIPEDQRKDFYFYVDEFQNFATEAFSSILSEARKYHLDLTIAHQYIAQLPDDVKATAFGNVGSIIVFPVGGDDAAYLVKEFAPVFNAEDLINLSIREMYIKMSVDGKLTPPFSARTLTVPYSQFDFTNEILNKSRLTYGKNRVSVENEIRQWSESTRSTVLDKSDKFPEPII